MRSPHSRVGRAARPLRAAACLALAALAPGCAVGLSETRPARILDPGQVQVTWASSIVVPLAVVSDVIDPARAALSAARAGGSLTDDEKRSLAGGAIGIALSSPGYATQLDAAVGLGYRLDLGARIANGSYGLVLRRGFDAGAWQGAVGLRAAYDTGTSLVPYLEELDRLVKAVDVSRYDVQGVLQLGRELGEWVRLWLGAKVVYSPWQVQLDASRIGLGSARTSGALAYYGGFAGLGAGYRWIHVVAELTVAYASGGADLFGGRYDLSGLTLVPTLGVQATL